MKPIFLAISLLLVALSCNACPKGYYILSGFGLAQIGSGVGN